MILSVLRIVAAIATILTGVASLFWPLNVQGFTGLTANGGRGITEIRTVLGALFIGLGGAALYFNAPEPYKMLGIMYLVMAVVRGISMFVDGSVISSNVISLIAEVIFGIILVL
jgi:hypothetical protein